MKKKYNTKSDCISILVIWLLLLGLGYSCNIGQNQDISSFSQVNNQSCTQDCCANLTPRPQMIYYYYQNTGKFKGGQNQWAINTMGYSGEGQGYLNPDYQCKPGGPLPSSTYTVKFCKNIMHESTNRPCSFYLMPDKPQDVCGRDDFFIHGCHCCTADDDTEPPYPGCSAGCIIIDYSDRKKIRIGDKVIVLHYQNLTQELKIA